MPSDRLNDLRITPEQEIQNVRPMRPHLAILGAGASRQAFLAGEANGLRLPVMIDFLDTLGLSEFMEKADLPGEDAHFEAVFSRLSLDPDNKGLCRELEERVYEYFDQMRLPDTPTLYDHLLLSLRPKDVIATFNWDPLLIQAATRNPCLQGRLPRLLFLHGNVLAGYCARCDVHGVKGSCCSRCEKPFEPSRLLYPVATKDYETDPMIRTAWAQFDDALARAFYVSIFGYSAPEVDRSAADRMRQAWRGSGSRELEEIEIIDVKQEDELREKWDDFIIEHHYSTTNDFYDSWIANHPRRTVEAFWDQTMEIKFVEPNPLPRAAEFEELWGWFGQLLDAEDRAEADPGGEAT